jgi:hypothetical protein
VYYIIGKELLNVNSSQTEKFWLIAKDINPWLGHHYTELISFYTFTSKSQSKIDKLKKECLLYPSAINECIWSAEHPNELSQPGSMIDYIKTYQ